MKVCSIIGARPQFIKIAPLSKELRKYHQEIIIHTGQHYDQNMSKNFFEQLQIPKPDHNLGIGSGTHGQQTGLMLKKIEEVLLKEKPDEVIVFGDTNSTLAGALTSRKLNIKTAHIEAGMRSFDKRMPEEINRIVTDHCSDILFCPNENSKRNLINENIKKNIFVVGNIMSEALIENLKKAEMESKIMENLNLKKKEYLLATVHRPSNTDSLKSLKSIVTAFIESKENIIFPMHPRTKKFMAMYGLTKKINSSSVKVINPIDYFDMLILEKNAKKILTDSGGIQNEAFLLGIPCITLRENTEWVETIEQKANMLVGSDKKKIMDSVKTFNPSIKKREQTEKPSIVIARILEKFE